jgi:hypothetical protein
MDLTLGIEFLDQGTRLARDLMMYSGSIHGGFPSKQKVLPEISLKSDVITNVGENWNMLE